MHVARPVRNVVTLTLSPLELAVEKLFPKPDPYLSDPAGWIRDELGWSLWSKQPQLVDAVRHHRNIAVKAAHSVGKTGSLAGLALWWIKVHPIGQALVVITSDNDDNIKGGIFQELIAAHEAATEAGRPFPGRITLDSKWHAGPNNQTLIAFGRKPSDRNPTGLQGFHRKYLLAIVDECCGVPAELWEAAESLASNAAGVVVAAGTRPIRHHTSPRCASRDLAGMSNRSAPMTLRRTQARKYPMTFSRTWSIPSGWPLANGCGDRKTLATSPASWASSRRFPPTPS